MTYFQHANITNATLASHKQKRHVRAHFYHLKLTNKMVPLTMPSVSYDVYIYTYLHINSCTHMHMSIYIQND